MFSFIGIIVLEERGGQSIGEEAQAGRRTDRQTDRQEGELEDARSGAELPAEQQSDPKRSRDSFWRHARTVRGGKAPDDPTKRMRLLELLAGLSTFTASSTSATGLQGFRSQIGTHSLREI